MTSAPTPVVVAAVPLPVERVVPQVVVMPSLSFSAPPPGDDTCVTVRPPTSVVDCGWASCAYGWPAQSVAAASAA